MKYISGNNLFIGALSLALAVGAFELFSSRKYQDVSSEQIFNSTNSSITKIEAEFGNKELFLNIHVTNYISCEEIVKILDVQSIRVKNKSYAPTCTNVDDSLIRITYRETTEV